MKELYVASKNKHKIEEIQEKLNPLGYLVHSLLDIQEDIEIVEDQDTFEGNALKKAITLQKMVNKPVLADDSGLIVDALDGAPGIYSARYAGEKATDEQNNQLLLKNLQTVQNRNARFITVMALVGFETNPVFTRGYLEGTIAQNPRGTNGFGYDPIFVVAGGNRHLSEYSLEEKNRISHRGKALEEIIQYLKTHDLVL
jgi:XTP/dITP diphosphohydrolase